MGASTSWIAVEGVNLEQVAEELRLAPAPPDFVADLAQPSYKAAVLPSGWVLLVRRMEGDGVVAGHALVAQLSSARRAVGCNEESHVMYSASSEWADGREVWAVIHSPELAEDHLVARGDPPPTWTAVRDAWLAKHAQAAKAGEGVDYIYEVPLELAKLVVGYRLESEDDDELEFVTLVAASSKPWWRFW